MNQGDRHDRRITSRKQGLHLRVSADALGIECRKLAEKVESLFLAPEPRSPLPSICFRFRR